VGQNSEGLQEIVGLEVAAEGVSAGTHSENWREIVPYCGSSDTETAGTKRSVSKQDIMQIGT